MKEIFIERHGCLLRIAVKNNKKLEECFMEDDTVDPSPGEIYRGVVKSIVPAIRSAFVNIGYKKNAYMYLNDKSSNAQLKKGDQVIVQVVKEGTYNKGPKVMDNINISGIYCAIVTLNDKINFSRKIDDDDKKKYIISNIKKPDGIGIMIRTAAQDVDVEVINDEIQKLYRIYAEVANKYKYSNKVGMLFDNGGMLGRVLRDRINNDKYKIYVNSEHDYVFVKGLLENVLNDKTSVNLYEDERSLFEYYGIEKEILSLINNRVYLNCGGYIVIDKTEAMYVIDVNSGKNVKGSTIEKTAYTTNYQAAEEIARQVRLRNLSGIIIVDFIDMKSEKNKLKVINKLQEGFSDDKNKTVIYPFTQLNLIQIARRRSNKSIYEYIEETCNACSGRGMRLKFEYLCMLIKNEIIKIKFNRNVKNIYIQVNQMYKENIEGNILDFIISIDSLDTNIYITYDPEGYFKVQPLIFSSQIEALKEFNVYNSDSVKLK